MTQAVTLDQKYDLDCARVLLSGPQALVRLPIMQSARDRRSGLNTAGFISGYRGSPIGTYDLELTKARRQLESHDIKFVPGINEDLAATAVWGTQQVHTFEGPRFDGVFSIWYGKGPGVDRSGDAFKHANIAGTAPHGGVLAIVGDDHPGKSSTVAHQSEQALAANSIPVLYPSTVAEVIEYGLLGWAASRFSGLWVALKCVNETLEATATVDLSSELVIRQPSAPPDQLRGIHFEDASQHLLAPVEDERRLVRQRMPLFTAFVAANNIDRVEIQPAERRLGIVAAGKTYVDVRHALTLLGLDDEKAGEAGIGLYKPGCIWPLEPGKLRSFARGYRELLFVEEKRAFLEDQAARHLYDIAADQRPCISGKADPAGAMLLPADGVLEPVAIAVAIASRLASLGLSTPEIASAVTSLGRQTNRQAMLRMAEVRRTPFFCSGCPHNRSTLVPGGAVALGGIGCHGMGIFMGRSLRSTHMGAEGLNWTGIAPFTKTRHVFQNVGDGTYSHSALLAIHAAVAARVNITYKILHNDAVAMTGGQPVESELGVARIASQLRALGVKEVHVVADEPQRLRGGLPAGVKLSERSALQAVQQELAKVKGVSALIYDQTCATEKRRRRKRGLLPAAPARALINERVCEGCGDCSVQSNCMSIVPLETPLGRKRAIDQASCNQDLSCVEGFCPSFVTVEGGKLRKPTLPEGLDGLLGDLPEPVLSLSDNVSVLVSGVGGTGVVTLAAVLAMAAHIDGRMATVYDMTGMAQKGGAVLSHLRIGQNFQIRPAIIGVEEADVILGCDLLVAASREVLRTVRKGATKIVLNTQLVPTGAFHQDPDLDFQADATRERIEEAGGPGHLYALDAADLARRWMGDAQLANMLMTGYAWQLGLLPLPLSAIERAIELNGVAVSQNLRAFSVGRLAAHRPETLMVGVTSERESFDLGVFIAARFDDLLLYQNMAYASRYRQLVDDVERCEAELGGQVLREAVARSYFKLMAYKDEYEVARLYSDGAFHRTLQESFEGPYRVRYHLAPPLLSRTDPATGRLRKLTFGPWVGHGFRLLASLRRLRGTPLDVFGYTEERRDERAAIADYEARIRALLPDLTASNLGLACEIAELPLQIRGYGPVKRASAKVAASKLTRLLEAWSDGGKSTSEASAGPPRTGTPLKTLLVQEGKS